MTALLAGLAFGLVGSGHCAAMCGPLVLLANPKPTSPGPHAHAATTQLSAHAALYHGGRALTYLVLGSLVGLASGAIAQLGFGRVLAVMAGAALVLQALAATGLVSGHLGSAPLAAAVTRALGRAGSWMRGHRVRGPIVFGAINGLLPCGLLYAALTAAAGFGDLRQALLFMGAFALGTTPVLAVLGVVGGALTAHVPLPIRRAAPAALAIVGVLLIARGIRAPHGDHATPATADASSSPSAPHAH